MTIKIKKLNSLTLNFKKAFFFCDCKINFLEVFISPYRLPFQLQVKSGKDNMNVIINPSPETSVSSALKCFI